ncbi:MAG TPA: ATP-dependent sacrificial sulfur transferase LarE [bacterium]|nr:ATP-dependent sacrificial sulfur transferase LarE [bacterium]
MERKVRKLREILKRMGKIMVAFSGGVDSSVLLKIATESLDKRDIIAVTAVSPTYTAQEKREAVKIARAFKVKHVLVETDEFKDKRFVANPPERCFYCKSELFKKMEQLCRQYGFDSIVDGTNRDDSMDFRPGEKARKIYGVRSPLQEAGMGKKEIRLYAKNKKLSFWDKPSMACIASRIPYGQAISKSRLKRIGEGEKFLRSLGFREVRLRDYGNLARIEISRERLEDAVRMKEKISRKLKKAGYDYITLDLEGFRSGSMNRALKILPPSNKNGK